MDRGERPAARALLLDTGGAGRLAEHAALRDKHDVAFRELLLELAGESSIANKANSPSIPLQRIITKTSGRHTWPGPCGKPSAGERGRRRRWPSFHHGHRPRVQPRSGGGGARS